MLRSAKGSILNIVVMESIAEKVTFEQTHEVEKAIELSVSMELFSWESFLVWEQWAQKS